MKERGVLPECFMQPAHQSLVLLSGLVVLTLLAYCPVWDNDFINLDDKPWITENPAVLSGLTVPGIQWAWTTFHGASWVPLTWLSLQADASLSRAIQGPRSKFVPLAVVFHGQNLFWHCATVVLLFVALRRMTGAVWRSALVAALFAVHPLHVESVAWATERKDVLSTFFLVLTLLAYGSYVQRPGVGRYLLVVVCFVLGLLAKPMLVTLPCVLLLLDWWPLQRWQNAERGRVGLLLEKAPLFVIAAAACVLTFVAQRHVGAVREVATISFQDRLANAVLSYGWYLEKTFWPTNLAIYYCHPGSNWHWGPVLASSAVLLTVTVLAIAGARRWPWLLVGWLWFAGTLVPVIGLVQVGDQARADRYAYVPHIGLFIAIVWSVAALLDRLRLPLGVVAGLAMACLGLLTIATSAQVTHWRNSEALWRHAVAADPDNHLAHCNLGRTLMESPARDDLRVQAEARQHFEQAVALEPKAPHYRICLGGILLIQGELEVAASHLQAALEQSPTDNLAWHNLGIIQQRQGKDKEAAESFRRAQQLSSGAADSH
jgi:hypothetical protein